jgi:hypothetical protein
MTSIMNPFESTFDLLQSLREEINELRLALVDEQHERARETSELRQQMIELKHAKNEKFDNVCNTVEELRQSKNSRFDKLEAYVEEFRGVKNQKYDQLDSKVETEINHREHSCRALDKTIQVEVSNLLAYSQKIDKEVQEHRRLAEIVYDKTKTQHEELRQEVENLGYVLRDNSMTRDPHKHFARRPGTQAKNEFSSPLISPNGGTRNRPLASSSSTSSPHSPQGPRSAAMNAANRTQSPNRLRSQSPRGQSPTRMPPLT